MASGVPPHSQSLSRRFGKPSTPLPPSRPWQGAQFCPQAAWPPAIAYSRNAGSASASSRLAAAKRLATSGAMASARCTAPARSARELHSKTPAVGPENQGMAG